MKSASWSSALRPICVVATFLCASLAMPAVLGGDCVQAPAATAIQTLVTMYRRDDNKAAVAEFLKWDEKRVARDARLPAGAPPADVGALVLMHTAAAVVRETFGGGNQSPVEDRTYFPAALYLVDSLSRRASTADDPGVRRFCRDWYIVAVALWSAGRDFQQAGTVARTGRSRLGDDPRLLLAAGSAAESLMMLEAPWVSREPAPTNNPGRLSDNALNAQEWLARAVSLDPSLFEARLRYGRVLYMLNRIPQARKELEQALADASAGNHAFAAYLAALFLGELFEHGGHLDEARAAYEKAIALHPEYQTAHLALGQVLVAAGRPDEGWAAARRVFGDTGKPREPERDPWVLYRSAQFWQAQQLLQGMFEWVRR